MGGHTDEVICVSVIADGKVVVPRSSDDTVQVWKMKNGGRETTVPEDLT